MTPDDNPILGEAPHLPGFFNDCGWDGHGVMHAPAGGLLMAELIVDGEATSADVSPFRVERFDGWLAMD
jgi:sarcosine oxidase subunit beta